MHYTIKYISQKIIKTKYKKNCFDYIVSPKTININIYKYKRIKSNLQSIIRFYLL